MMPRGRWRKFHLPLQKRYHWVRFRLIGHYCHFLMLLLLFTIIVVSIVQSDALVNLDRQVRSENLYSSLKTSNLIILYFFRLITLIALPMTLANFIGIVFFNTFPKQPKVRGSMLFGPFVCFRVVTKGLYPRLVRNSVYRNLEICSSVGFNNFVIEVVSDVAINLPKLPKVRELVVPKDYQSSRGSLYKARALQYCLEDGVNTLEDADWIVHLDEETLVTESSLIGIINFIIEAKYDFGQGVILYGHGDIVNWLTTLLDVVRVGIDYGMLRFCLKFLHKPVFSWKGSFIVSKAGTEKKVSYDFGPEGSIAEDCFFAILAWSNGFSFGFVDGDMLEKSTFSCFDYIRQRKRWVQGILLVLLCRLLPWRYKIGITCMILSWMTLPLAVPNIIFAILFPLPMPALVNVIGGFMSGTFMFLFVFGAIKSFSRNLKHCHCILVCLASVLVVPIAVMLESVSVIWALFSRKKGFDIVRKEII